MSRREIAAMMMAAIAAASVAVSATILALRADPLPAEVGQPLPQVTVIDAVGDR